MPPFERNNSEEEAMKKKAEQLSDNEISTLLLPNENETRGQFSLRISRDKFLSIVMAEKVKRDRLLSTNHSTINNVAVNTEIPTPKIPPHTPPTEVDQPEVIYDGKGGWTRKNVE